MDIYKLTNRLFEIVPLNGSTEFRIRSLGKGSYSVSHCQLDEGKMTPVFRPPKMKTLHNIKFNVSKPEELLEWLDKYGLRHHIDELNAAAAKLAERERQAYGNSEKLG